MFSITYELQNMQIWSKYSVYPYEHPPSNLAADPYFLKTLVFCAQPSLTAFRAIYIMYLPWLTELHIVN